MVSSHATAAGRGLSNKTLCGSAGVHAEVCCFGLLFGNRASYNSTYVTGYNWQVYCQHWYIHNLFANNRIQFPIDSAIDIVPTEHASKHDVSANQRILAWVNPDRHRYFFIIFHPNCSPEAIYYEGRYGSKFPGMQLGGNANGGGFMSIVHATPYPQAGMNVAVSWTIIS